MGKISNNNKNKGSKSSKTTKTKPKTQNTKTRKIYEEKKKLKEIFETIPENKRKLCDELINNAAFMSVTLKELQAIINKEGAVYSSVNGNGFEVIQEHPAQKSYNTMIGQYKTVINQLVLLLPDSKETAITKAGENLARLVAGGKPVQVR